MSRELPAQPNLEHLRKQAKNLLREWRRQDSGTLRQLADAQHELANEYGFSNWATLKEHVESASPGLALTHAIEAHDPEAIRRVLRSAPALRAAINEPLPGGSFGQTALLAAVQRTNGPMIDALLELGADINQKSHWWAGGFGVLDETSIEFAPFLLERGAKLDAPAAARLGMMDALHQMVATDPSIVHMHGPDGQTPLHQAGTIEVARFLLEHGADMDALDVDHESTPAQYMLRVTQTRHFARDRQDIARELVARGCKTDILMASALGDMALVEKHLNTNPESIRTRVDGHYFPKIDPKAGGTIYIWVLGHHRTAHSVAKSFGHPDVYRLLMDRSPHDLRLAIAAEVGDEGAFQELKRERPDLLGNLSDDDKRKVADAAENNNVDAVKLMLGAGWPVDVLGGHGGSSLHWAAFHGNAAMVREILRHQPKVDLVDATHEMTPLGWACYGSENGWHRDTGDYAGAVELLLDAGAKSPPTMEEFEASDAVREVIRRHGS